jgi:hypothetical protein
MMKKFKELLMEKAKMGKFLSDDEKQAKSSVVKEIKDLMRQAMGEDLKKVTVAAPTVEGLKAGLKKASEVVEEKKDELEDSEKMEESEDEEVEKEEMSKEDRIKKLKEELAKLEME